MKNAFEDVILVDDQGAPRLEDGQHAVAVSLEMRAAGAMTDRRTHGRGPSPLSGPPATCRGLPLPQIVLTSIVLSPSSTPAEGTKPSPIPVIAMALALVFRFAPRVRL